MPVSWDEVQVESQTRLVHWVRCTRCGWESDSSEDLAAVEAERHRHHELHLVRAAEVRALVAPNREGGQ